MAVPSFTTFPIQNEAFFNRQPFSFISLPELPEIEAGDEVKKMIGLIDVIWFEKGTYKIVSTFEVEKSTSIYSGILRLTDLALTLPNSEKISLYLAAPEQRVFSELYTHCDSICKFGDDYTIMEKIAKCIR